MKTRPVFLCVLLLASVSLNAGEADIVKYRQALMKSMAGYMNAMTAITKGAPFRHDLALHAAAVKELARQMPSMFPAGTSPDKAATDALPEVWTKPAQFKAAAQKLETEAGKMQQLAKTNDMKAIAAQLEVLDRQRLRGSGDGANDRGDGNQASPERAHSLSPDGNLGDEMSFANSLQRRAGSAPACRST